MMCNPNMKPNGSEKAGSKTGSWQPDTNQYLCERLELWEKSCRGIRDQILELQESWLNRKLVERGLPQFLADGVEAREERMIRLAAKWVRLHGYSYGSRHINTIELYQHGELVCQEELFAITYEAPTCD